jgi:hypothetical protein
MWGNSVQVHSGIDVRHYSKNKNSQKGEDIGLSSKSKALSSNSSTTKKESVTLGHFFKKMTQRFWFPLGKFLFDFAIYYLISDETV